MSALLGLSAAFVGLWAEFGPQSWYDDFPLPGHRWVSTLGPYNEHLARDVGGLYLALLVVSVWAVVRPRPETFRLVGAAWSVFSVPHLIFHLLHLDMFPTLDRTGNIVTLAGTAVLAAALLFPVRTGHARAPHSADQVRTD